MWRAINGIGVETVGSQVGSTADSLRVGGCLFGMRLVETGIYFHLGNYVIARCH